VIYLECKRLVHCVLTTMLLVFLVFITFH